MYPDSKDRQNAAAPSMMSVRSGPEIVSMRALIPLLALVALFGAACAT